MKKLGLFPEFQRGDSFPDKYVKVNQVLNNLKEKYAISLWQLDAVLGVIAGSSPFPKMPDEDERLILGELYENRLQMIPPAERWKHAEAFWRLMRDLSRQISFSLTFKFSFFIFFKGDGIKNSYDP